VSVRRRKLSAKTAPRILIFGISSLNLSIEDTSSTHRSDTTHILHEAQIDFARDT
jgi:hypothetical protein